MSSTGVIAVINGHRFNSNPTCIISWSIKYRATPTRAPIVIRRPELMVRSDPNTKLRESNTIAPVVVSGVLEVFSILSASTERRDKLEQNTEYWRKGLTEAGLVLKEGNSPIVPVMLFNAKLAQDFSRDLFSEGVYAVGFFFPVVPNGQARIRTQISACHEIHHLDKALKAFIKIGKKYEILGLSKQEIIAKYGL